jgi:hypothetical protein
MSLDFGLIVWLLIVYLFLVSLERVRRNFFFFLFYGGQLFLLHPLYIGLFFFQIIFLLFSYTATLKERKSSGSKDLAVFFATFLRHSASFTYTILVEFCEKSVFEQKIEPK